MRKRIKTFLKSKTFWVNVLAFVAFILQGVLGKEAFPPELQASILAVINVVLRFITGEPISWSTKDRGSD